MGGGVKILKTSKGVSFDDESNKSLASQTRMANLSSTNVG